MLARLQSMVAQGLFISACSVAAPREALPPVTPWPNPFIQKDAEPRFPDAERLRYFEGMTLVDFKHHLPPLKGREEALKKIADIIKRSEGDPSKVDSGDEAFSVGALFAIEEDGDDPEYLKTHYPHLIPFTITANDMWLYMRETFPGEQARVAEQWRDREAEIRTNFGYSEAEHPFAALIDKVHLYHKATMRSTPTFHDIGPVLLEYVPRVRESRDLTVLYPGSGAHIAPLVTAMRLIDENVIDHARYIFTEIDETHLGTLRKLIETARRAGLVAQTEYKLLAKFDDGGEEISLQMTYRGKLIEIFFAFKRSEGFFRDEYLREADWIVIHDVAGLKNSYVLLAELLKARHGAGVEAQLVTMEGEPFDEPWFEIHFPAALKQEFISGQYGHCEDLPVVGEISNCAYKNARAFLLNDPALQSFAASFASTEQLTDALIEYKDESGQ